MGDPTLSSEHLRAIPLFRGLEAKALTELAARFELVKLGPDEKLFTATRAARAMFVLSAGEVSIGRDDAELHRLRPPAVIGELGALTGIPRTSDAIPSADAQVWSISADSLRSYIEDNPGHGGTMMGNLLSIVADKVSRDQQRLDDMRANIIRTQKEMKRVRDYLLESQDTAVSEFVHKVIAEQIKQNRRVNYRVRPPIAHPARFKSDTGDALPALEISRTHLSVSQLATARAVGERVSGVLDLDGIEIAVSGKVLRALEGRIDVEIDLLVDDYAAALEGYLTRVQLLDFLV